MTTEQQKLLHSAIARIKAQVFIKHKDYATAPGHVKLFYNIVKQSCHDLTLPVYLDADGVDVNLFDRESAILYLNTDLGLAQALIDPDWVRRVLYESKLLERK